MRTPRARIALAPALALLGALAAGPLRAASAAGPDEDALFGPDFRPVGQAAALSPTALPSSPTAETAGQGASSADARGLSLATLGVNDFTNGTVKNDPLQIGGTVYQQIYMDEPLYQAPGASTLSMPLEVDTYLDARPSDRVRAYVVGRLLYNPTLDAQGLPDSGSPDAGLSAGSYAGVSATASNPSVVLDQAWVEFDIKRTVFLTAGKQHVKWGTGHIWNPTDFLSPQRLNPLQPYDERLGSTMVNLQMPVAGMDDTNLYAIALLDNPVPASSLSQVGGAFRAETLVGPAEVGADAVFRDHVYPDYGFDLSTPLGPIDVYAENALLSGRAPSYAFKAAPTAGGDLSSVYGLGSLQGPLDQSVAGFSYDFAWRADREATFDAEYFYNETGLNSPKLLPVLIYLGQYTPFYMGKNYAAVDLSAQGPDEGKNTNYNLSTIVNLTDGSAVSRLDFTWLLLNYLTYGAWVSVRYGTPGGELNFALDTPRLNDNGTPIPAVDLPSTPVELGMSLRMAY